MAKNPKPTRKAKKDGDRGFRHGFKIGMNWISQNPHRTSTTNRRRKTRQPAQEK